MTNILILALFMLTSGTTYANGGTAVSLPSEYERNSQTIINIHNSLIYNLKSNNIYPKYIESSKSIIKKLEELLSDAKKNNKILEGEYITSLIALTHKALDTYLIKH